MLDPASKENIENFIMAEILQPSDKIKLILYYFNNEPV
jgi:hypothetical protein